MSNRSNEYLDSLFGLSGKTTVVIGGTGTLGGSFCDALAGAGAHVVVVGRNDEHGAEAVRRIPGAADQPTEVVARPGWVEEDSDPTPALS